MPPSTEHASSPEQTRWFAQEVQPHEPSLRSYLRGSFPAVRDVDDVVQESYLRILRSRAAEPVRSAKAFLFRVARNVALDLVRRKRNSPVDQVGDLAALPVMEEGRGIVEAIGVEEKLDVLAEAIAALPPRCRETVVLCKIKGLSRREAAERLGLSERTVDEHLFRGYQRLDAELRKRGVTRFSEP